VSYRRYHALSLRYACIQNSGISLTSIGYIFVTNFVSFATSIVELAHGDKSRTQSPSLFDACYRALSLRYACIQSSGIILIPYASFVPNFVTFAASIAEVTHGEKLHT